MTTLPVADARAQLSRLIEQATTTHERSEITRNGRRAAVLLSADGYDTLQDTIAVLSDAELIAAHREGRAAIEAGDDLDADQLADVMREAAARSPSSVPTPPRALGSFYLYSRKADFNATFRAWDAAFWE